MGHIGTTTLVKGDLPEMVLTMSILGFPYTFQMELWRTEGHWWLSFYLVQLQRISLGFYRHKRPILGWEPNIEGSINFGTFASLLYGVQYCTFHVWISSIWKFMKTCTAKSLKCWMDDPSSKKFLDFPSFITLFCRVTL